MVYEYYRTDPATLVSALSESDMLRRYLAAQEAELTSLADRALARHIRRMSGLASRAMATGMTSLATQEPANADELLSDILAVATWNHWDLPLERLPHITSAMDGLPRGLLGADVGQDGVSVWVIDHGHVVLARSRESSDDLVQSHQHDHG